VHEPEAEDEGQERADQDRGDRDPDQAEEEDDLARAVTA
jgi:hypothetical protein